MGTSLSPLNLGWHPIDPGPGPRSPLLDSPPTPTATNYLAAYTRWRADVDTDERRLAHARQQGPLWFPIPLSPGVAVLPVYGGTPAAVEQLATTLVISGLEAGLESCRVVNLSGWDVSGALKSQMAAAKRNRVRFDDISSRGSTFNLFGNPQPAELIALLVDAVRVSAERSSGRQTQQERQELERVVKLLRGQVSLERIIEAVDIALGAPGSHPSLDVDEIRDLQDYFAGVTGQRRATQDRLSDLHVDLAALRAFEKDPARLPETAGSGPTSIRWYDVSSGSSTDEVELGRQLIARAMLQRFSRPGPEELLVIVGAERLADEVSTELVAAAHRTGKRAVFIYTQITDAAQRALGYAGSSVAVFMKLPNPVDAAIAAEFLGHEYKFVVNGISISEGQTQDWSNSFGTSTSRSTSHSSTSSSTSGFSGRAFNFSRSVGSSVTSTFERGTSTTTSSGGSKSTTTARSTGRVHEYVLEPEVFQQMPDDLMLIVSNGTVAVASCESKLRWSKQTSRQHTLELP